MMLREQENVVSVWVGMFRGPDEFAEYMEESYGDPDSAISGFGADIGCFYDHDFMESSFEGLHCLPVDLLLHGREQAAVFGEPALHAAKRLGFRGGNVVICLYDHLFEGPMQDDAKVTFLGSFDVAGSTA